MRVPRLGSAVLVLAVQLSCAVAPPAPPNVAAPSSAPAAAAVPASVVEESPPLLQLPRNVRPVRYALDLEVDPSKDGFHGEVAIEIVLESPSRTIWLHGRGLKVTAASITPAGGASIAATYRQVNDDGLARVDVVAPVGPGSATVRFEWDAGWGDAAGLFRSRSGEDVYVASQLEAHHARRVFPSFDEPRFKTPWDVTITVPESAVALSNGLDAGAEPVPRGRRFRFATTKPLPTYLLFLGAGPYEVVAAPPLPANELRPAPVPLRGFAPRGRGAEIAVALRETAEMLGWQERWFGIAYPYEKLDSIVVIGLPFGGMENAGAIAYADRVVLLGPGAGLQARQFRAALVAHEVSHHWFGDLVTLPWWTDIWLNESFATWITHRTLEAVRPDGRPELDERRGSSVGAEPNALTASIGGVEWTMQGDALPTARAVRKPLARMADVGAQFDAASYTKGAAVLAMASRWIGLNAFRAGVRTFLEAHAHGIGTTPELLDALSRAAGRDVAAPMSTFLERAGIPLVEARVACEGGKGFVHLSQAALAVRGSVPAAGTWSVPVCLRYRVDGADRERCHLLESGEDVMAIPEGCPEWIFPNAGAAGYYRAALAAADLDRLVRFGLAHLTALEKIALAGDVRAVQRTGRLAYVEAMRVLSTLARDSDPGVAAAAMPAFAHARRNVVPASARATVEAEARALYGPSLRRVGWTARSAEGSEERRWRAELVRFLLRTGRDTEATREAAWRGSVYLGIAGRPADPAAIDPDLIEDAVAAAVSVGGAPALDAAVAMAFSTADASARVRILSGIAAAGRADLVPRTFEIARDGRLAGIERVYAIENTFKDPSTRASALEALERDVEELLRAFPSGRRRLLAFAIGWLCDAGDAARVQALLEPRLGGYPELRLPLADAFVRIRACAAERDADGEAAARWFAARARPVARAAR
jgi:alanyl aminopeptidase